MSIKSLLVTRGNPMTCWKYFNVKSVHKVLRFIDGNLKAEKKKSQQNLSENSKYHKTTIKHSVPSTSLVWLHV